MDDTQKYCDFEEFARLTGLSVSTLKRRKRDGSLFYFQPGGPRSRVLIPRDAIERVLSQPKLAVNVPEKPSPAHLNTKTPRLPGPLPKWAQRVAAKQSRKPCHDR
jgi:hypothetical protein